MVYWKVRGRRDHDDIKAFRIPMDTILQASFYASLLRLEVCSLPVGIKWLVNPWLREEICTRLAVILCVSTLISLPGLSSQTTGQ
jgi:hypothetical protein